MIVIKEEVSFLSTPSGKNKIAVLVGDFLLARGMLLSVDHGDFDLLRIISVAMREISEGELLQLEKARRLDIDEDIYYDIIRQKTATLNRRLLQYRSMLC